jgi:hypothetical protein
MLSSLVAQTDIDWKANVVIDNPEGHDLMKIVNSFEDDRIKGTFMDKRYNDFGHTPRQFGKQLSNADYIIMTGDDNYYTPNFIHELRIASKNKPGIIYWDMVHSHFHYAYFKCALANGQIDIGAFATRNDIAKQIDLGVRYDADGWFVEKFKQQFANEEVIKIDKVLFVHN